MAVTQQDILTTVLNLCGNHPQLPSTVVSDFIKSENREIQESYDWSRRNVTLLINTVAPITTGTVNATQGSQTIQGNGTAFTAGMVGQYFRLGEDTYFKITGVNVGLQQLTIEVNYPYPSVNLSGYTIFQYVYSLPAGYEKIRSIKSRTVNLIERSKILIAMYDASLSSTDADPESWAYGNRLSDANGNPNILTFEIWPPPSDSHPLIIEAELTNDVINPNDTPLYRGDVLKWKVVSDAADYLDSLLNNPYWAKKSERWYKLYEAALATAKEDDFDKQTTPTKIMPSERSIGVGDDFLSQHDSNPLR